jgi:molybdopterin-guanine dinucleotide biosynthesis protein MobB
MEGIPVLGMAGWSGSGKTTLLEGLLPRLRARGLRVAVVKHDAHGLTLDREGKDSQRFARAGAEAVALSSPRQSVLLIQRALSLEELLNGIHGVDLILLEGFKGCSYTQLGVCRAENGKGFTDELGRFAALVTDVPGLSAPGPVFGLNDYDEIAEFIMNNMEDFTRFSARDRDGKAEREGF